MSRQKTIELEKRIDLVMKGMNLVLFGQAEAISPKEKKEIKKRLKHYVTGKSSEFLELKDLQSYRT